jgi:DNA-binding MurR/RpiR family transcriptional regulator
VLIENLNSSSSSIDHSTFDNAVDLLADGRMRCTATGGRFSGVVNALGDRAIARVSDYESLWAGQGFTEPGIVD